MRSFLYMLPMLLFLVLATFLRSSLHPGYDTYILPSAMLGKLMPAFTLPGLGIAASPDSLSRDGIVGQLVVINFFASWCEPCRIEHPILMRLAHETGVPLYGIAYKDKPEDVARLLRQFGDPYHRIGLDLNGRTGLDFGVYGVPETYVLDKSGTIRKRFVGPLNVSVVETELLPLLKSLSRP